MTGAHLFLGKLLSRSRLTEAEQAAVLALAWNQPRSETQGDFIVRGSEVNTCCIVLEGLVARTGITVDGGRQITAFYLPGDMPDLHALVLPRATANLEAVCSSRILRIARTDLYDITARFPGIARALWRETIADAVIASEWTVNVGRRPAKQRLAHLFCEMAWRIVRNPTERFDFLFPVTQTHLAEATGLSNVHINRVLQELRRDRLVDLKGHRAIVDNWTGLQDEAGFDPAYLSLAERAPTSPL